MSLWLKIFIGLWLYLSFGFGVLLFSQIIAKNIKDSDGDSIWYTNLKIDPDDYEFDEEVAVTIIFWPVLLISVAFMLIELNLKKIFRRIWKD